MLIGKLLTPELGYSAVGLVSPAPEPRAGLSMDNLLCEGHV
jgi:hypothetical protein